MSVRVVAIFSAVCFLGFTPKLKANELDNAAACSGVVLGNASIAFKINPTFILKQKVETGRKLSENLLKEHINIC